LTGKRKITLFILAGIGILILLYFLSRSNYLLFHSVVELFSISIACTVFIIVIATHRYSENKSFLFLGITYFFVGVIDLFHVLSYKGMGVLNLDSTSNFATQFWIAARLLEALSLILFVVFYKRHLNILYITVFYFLITVFLIYSILILKVFPDCYIEGRGLTPFKTNMEYAISFILLGAIILLIRNRQMFDQKILRLMVIAIILTIVTELTFTLYVDVYGVLNALGHFLKTLSFSVIFYALVYSSLTNPYSIIFHDLEKKQKSLENSEKKYRSILETAIDGFWLVDLDSNLIEINDAYCKMSGYSERELQRMKISDLEASENASEIASHIDEIIEHGGDRFERVHRRKDGTLFDVAMSVKYQNTDGGRIICFIRDISDKNKMINELTQSEERFRSLHNASFGGITIHDKGLILECNKGLSEITGYDYNELIGMNGLLLISDSTREMVLENISSEYEKPYEAIGVKKNGEEYPLRLEARSIPYKGESVRVVEFRDLTEQKKTEKEKEELMKQLTQVQKMESVGRLAGGIAHDFNNVLSGIMSASQLLKQPRRNLDQKGLKYVNMILDASKRAADLSNSLLLFSRKNSDDFVPLNFHEIIHKTRTILAGTLDKRIAIDTALNAESFMVKGHLSELHNALMNLCLNSSHAVNNSGSIVISTGNKRLDSDFCRSSNFDLIPGKYFWFQVTDDGCGIPEDVQKNIFDPFFTTKKIGAGSGLGLSGVYGTIQNHKGAVVVNSIVGKGSDFRIYLPITSEKVKLFNEPDFNNKLFIKNKGEKILIVDDDDINSFAMKGLIESLGFKVTIAVNGLEALKLYREDFSLIFLDMNMPEMNGYETYIELKKINKNCKIIISTGFCDNEELDELRELGLEGVLYKPFQINELCKQLDIALHN